MVSAALLVIGIIIAIIGLIVIGVGAYFLYKEKHPSTSSTTAVSDDLGWGLIVGGIVSIFIGVILMILGYTNKNKAAKMEKLKIVESAPLAMHSETANLL
jgi:uncharacterized membrane protein